MGTRYYELWDMEAGNLMGAYPSEALALAEVRAGLAEDGEALWHEVGLRVAGEGPGESRRIALGDELIALARAAPEVTTRRATDATEPIGGPAPGMGSVAIALPDMDVFATGRVRVTMEDGVLTAEVRTARPVRDETTPLTSLEFGPRRTPRP